MRAEREEAQIEIKDENRIMYESEESTTAVETGEILTLIELSH